MTSPNSESTASSEDLPQFEDAIERLEEIVRRMEEERIPLEQLVENYEKGMKLLKVCKASIDTARARVDVITKAIDGEKPELATFDGNE